MPAQAERPNISTFIFDPDRCANSRLAWLCSLRQGLYDFTLGISVEEFDGGFFEGVWDRDFGNPANIPEHNHFGSGVLSSPTGALFIPPKHLFEHIYWLEAAIARLSPTPFVSVSWPLNLLPSSSRKSSKNSSATPMRRPHTAPTYLSRRWRRQQDLPSTA